LLLQVGNREAATTHDLCRIRARRRYRLTRRVLTGLPPALERRVMPFP